MKQLFIGLIIAFTLFLTLQTPSSAQVAQISCQPVFGGGTTCSTNPSIIVKKTVFNPESKSYSDNLGRSSANYSPTESVNFKITLTNTTDSEQKNITIKDVFPQGMRLESGAGSYDSGTNTLTITLDSLGGKSTRGIIIKATLADSSEFDKEMTCLVNKVFATAGTARSQDSSQFCIKKDETGPSFVEASAGKQENPSMTKGGLPLYPNPQTSENPNTGPELLALIGLIPTGIVGWKLRKASL